MTPAEDTEALRELDPGNVYREALRPYPYMMKPKDVADFLGQSRQAITGLLRTGRMKGVKSGDCWLVPQLHLIAYLIENTNVTEPQNEMQNRPEGEMR